MFAGHIKEKDNHGKTCLVVKTIIFSEMNF